MATSTEISNLDGSPYHLLKRATQYAANLFADEVGYRGLTHRQFTLLLAIAQNEGASQTGLVKVTGIDRSTLADLIRRLLKQGYVQRRRTREDSRTYTIKLSAAGRRALQAAQPGAAEVDKLVLQAVPSELRKGFIEALGALSEAHHAQMDREEEEPERATAAKRRRKL